ncbi:MAG: hypothetical protein CVV27_17440 [Candidatus Melainabacteria bacterium HGW-Melainabacteria-1]|nr:MAG: hypothetical protein CVV27_17440 [Candidatus Melainabacteria bacterium HGW-Melainabacteria-1]
MAMYTVKALLSLSFALGLLASTMAPAQAQFLIGPQAELTFVRGPNYPADSSDSRTGLLLGVYAGASGFELIPMALISEGQYRGFLLEAGLRVTPKWFGQDEYLFNLFSPYAVLSGTVGYPWSIGWHAKAGVGVALLQYGSINAEIGYRSHRLDQNTLLEGVTLGMRATYPF